MSEPRGVIGVPYYGADREFARYRPEYLRCIERILETGQVLQGREVKELERKVADIVGRKHAVAVNSATDGLFFALSALGIGPGDEVLVPDFSFVASASSIRRTGAVPVFVDVTEEYHMDLLCAEEAVTKKTKGMVFVHLFGRVAKLDEVENFARRHRLPIVEDAAQVFGATYRRRPAGSLGDVSCFSFDPTKVLSAPGSGGICVTDELRLAQEIQALRYHGKRGDEFGTLGFNSQMSSIAAGVLLVKLRYSDEWRGARRKVAHKYNQAFGRVGTIVTPRDDSDAEHIFHKYVIRVCNRDRVHGLLSDAGIQCAIHYQRPLHAEPLFRRDARIGRACHVAARLSDEVLSLPVHPFLTEEETDRVIRSVLVATGTT